MKRSAGILGYCIHEGKIKVFLVHPGGPYFRKKDFGVWTIPKGEFEDEDPLDCAKREFREETGMEPPSKLTYLGEITYSSGSKTVKCWAGELEYRDNVDIKSNTFEMEWPPGSGKREIFPEVDKGSFVTIPEAKRLLHKDQSKFLDALEKLIDRLQSK
jgi:predicted NUDIX family NTP pyrophosphohydrolase